MTTAANYSEAAPRRPLAWDTVVAEGNLPGANDEAESDAGDKAIPLEYLGLPKNDIAAPQDRGRLNKRLNNQALRERIFDYLKGRHNFPRDHADDAANMTLFRAFQAKSWPEDEAVPFYAWLRRYANITRLRYQRALQRGERVEATEDMDAFPVELKPYMDDYYDVLRAIKAVLAEGRPLDADTAEIIRAKIEEGKSFKESALERGISEEAVNQRVHRFLTRVRKHMLASGAAAAVLLCIVFLLIREVLIPEPVTSANPAPIVDDLRERGLTQCRQGHFEPCLHLLDRAKALDPAGDTDPAIVKARADAAKAMAPADVPR
jgi:DNA-directed RNA polymerase specialized sigma24 family protein